MDDMAPEASEGEQSKEVKTLPAAPDPDPEPEQQQARDVTAHQDYSEEGVAAVATKIEGALSKLQPRRERISQLLGPAGPHRVVVSAGDAGRRCLAFMETELSIIAAFLTTLSPQHLDDAETKEWLGGYSFHVLLLWVDDVLREVDPSRHTLLRRASQCFHRRKSYSRWLLPLETVNHYYSIEHRFRYRHLLHTSSGLGLITSQLAEAGALLPLVGINRPAKKIFRWLAHQGKMDMNTRVMSIVGPVGIGKTTLAVELLNRLIRHETSSGGCYYFQCNVMAQASRGTSDRNIRLLQDILSQVSPAATALSSDPSQAKTMEVLVRLVSECLRDKRYFVIIDDIWKASDWEEIKGAFPNNNHGSRILITTRSTCTAWACCSDSYYGLVHEMKPLSEMDSERLLLAKAVGSVDGCVPNNIKLHCDEILRRCDGIPLFIIGMADWLKEQGLQQLHQPKDEDEEHQGFAMHYEEQVPRLPERLEQALSSAFSDFPNDDDSRLPLLYMSMFPYGYKFEKDRLILKWIHDGFTQRNPVSPDFSIAMLEAELFFSQLVDRNVITCVASNCKHKQDEAEACQWQINHFMHQFLASKSAEMGFVFTTTTLNLLAASAAATTTECGNQTSSRMPRRLALHHPDPLLPSLLETMDLSQTRSLAVSGTVCRIPVDKFVNLVVLDLEGWENLKDEDLLQVCTSKMFFLRYLSVRNTQVHKLPYEIKELRSLGTLDVSYTQITELPHEIKEMWRLRTLDISYTQINKLPLELFQLEDLEHLDLRGTQISQLPKQIVGLQGNLVRLFIGSEGSVNSVETAMPQDVRRLYNLETLATVDLTRHPASFVMALGNLLNLTVLAVTWSFYQSTDRDYCEALLSCIEKSKWLESLTIHCGLGCSMEFLGSLETSRGLKRLKKFKVTAGRFASVPQWIDGLEHLAFVQITVCNKQTTTDDLKILGDLPELQFLILGLDFIPGQAIVIENEGFSKLQRFSVDCPMPWLSFSTGDMQKLTYLQLKFCSTPASQICVPSGISNLHGLTEVALCYNAQYLNSPSIKMTVEAVTKQVAEHCNPIDLYINGIEQDDVQQADDEVTEITIGTSSRTNNAEAEDDAQAVGEEATAAIECEITEAES